MNDDQLLSDLLYLKLAYFREHHQTLAKEAVEQNRTHLDFLSRLVEGEALRRKDRATQRRIQAARFPVVKTLEQFNWSWPKKINRPQVQNLFRLSFLQDKANVIFLGGAGLGIMPGTGLCRAVRELPLNNGPEWFSTRHNPPQAIGCFCDGEFTIRLLNDTIIKLTCKKWRPRQR